MNITTKPIKRSKQLVSLSREHHDGLLLCWKIRAGFRNNIETERINNYVQFFYQNNLAPHFEQEELLLFPLLPSREPMIIEALAQHDILRGMIETLRSAGNKNILLAFADELDNHIRFEERQLFGQIEKSAEPGELMKIADLLNKQDKQFCKPTWDDEFWNFKK